MSVHTPPQAQLARSRWQKNLGQPPGELFPNRRDCATTRRHLLSSGPSKKARRGNTLPIPDEPPQGFEAGGHRGIFDPEAPDSEFGIRDLLTRSMTSVRVPLIAAGGIMTAEDIREALGAGAQGVQMGTAFLASVEAGTSAPYRSKLLGAARKTRTTRVFSGRLARGIENRFMQEMAIEANAILPFPAQNKFTRDIRGASAAKGSADFLSLWSGNGQGNLWRLGIRIDRSTIREMNER